MSELFGNRLIYLVSQPRAGSTMLQRMLACHDEIHTISEPWLMLHPIYALRDTGYEAEYCGRVANIAFKTFLAELPGGEEDFLSSLRLGYWPLYRKMLEGNGAQYFLDKTPRYYFIIPELLRVFPDARMLLLIRNPLAVLMSVMKTWVHRRVYRIREHMHDLVDAPKLLAQAIQTKDSNVSVIRYEHLVSNPHSTVEAICQTMNLDFQPQMVDYGALNLPKWRLGDQSKVYAKAQPDATNQDRWKDSLKDAQLWRFAHDYLMFLGSETISTLGYDYEGLRHMLLSRCPTRKQRQATISLDSALNDDPEHTTEQEPKKQILSPVMQMIKRMCRSGSRKRAA